MTDIVPDNGLKDNMADDLRPSKRRKIAEEDGDTDCRTCDDISGGLEPLPIPCINENEPISCLGSFEKVRCRK